MSETGAILIVVGLFVGFFALAVVGLKIKDRLRHPENAGRITARPDQWRAAILVSVCLLAIPLIVWLKRTFSPTELLLVVVPLAIVFVVWMSRKRSGVNALLESLANEFGWIEDPARGKRSFTVSEASRSCQRRTS